MPNTALALLAVLLVALGLAVGWILSARRAGSRWIRGLIRATREAEQLATAEAFARAAQAVGMWPHRVTHRADLMRHLDSLATAPEIAANLPEEAPAPRVHRPIAVSPGLPEDDDAERAVDVYREHGFL